MSDSLHLPITDEGEARALLDELPVAVDAERFVEFVMGFPRRYLVKTPRVEIVKHFLLMQSRANRPLISSLSPEQGSWKLCVVAEDRDYLFSNVAGSLSCFGMNISAAEAIGNANAIVLDTFHFSDEDGAFADSRKQQDFQAYLERVLSGEEDLRKRFEKRLGQVCIHDCDPIRVEVDNDTHPRATRMMVDFPDHFGHLYLVSQCLSEHGASIEMAYVEIEGGRIRDDFYLTFDGAKLDEGLRIRMEAELIELGHRFHRSGSPSAQLSLT